jgi:hypothetical protein
MNPTNVCHHHQQWAPWCSHQLDEQTEQCPSREQQQIPQRPLVSIKQDEWYSAHQQAPRVALNQLVWCPADQADPLQLSMFIELIAVTLL